MRRVTWIGTLGGLLGLTVAGLAGPPSDAEVEHHEALADYALTHDGPAGLGRVLYRQLGCASCHGAEGKGGRRGPPLTDLARRSDRAEVIRSVLDPSALIAPGYQRVTVVTKSGKTVSGRLRNDLGDDTLEVLTGGGKLVKLSQADVESARLSEESDMPGGLADELSEGEFAALISYLMDMK